MKVKVYALDDELGYSFGIEWVEVWFGNWS